MIDQSNEILKQMIMREKIHMQIHVDNFMLKTEYSAQTKLAQDLAKKAGGHAPIMPRMSVKEFMAPKPRRRKMSTETFMAGFQPKEGL